MDTSNGIIKLPKEGKDFNFNVLNSIPYSIYNEKKPKFINPVFNTLNQSKKSISINARPVLSDNLTLYNESSKNKNSLSFNYDFEKEEFLMNSPVTQQTFEQFEKRFTDNVKTTEKTLAQLGEDFKENNKILVEIKKSLVTEKEVSKIIEDKKNERIAKLTLYILVGLGSSVMTLVVQWIIKFLDIN